MSVRPLRFTLRLGLRLRRGLALGLALAVSIAPHLAHAHVGAHEAGTDTAKTVADTTKAASSDWFVNTTHGPADTVRFELNEGSWMSVDVSPDGRTLVFDLLGDLYTLPISGGTAARLTSGPAWDYGPRWSPDGRRLLFTSDRGGCDNVWAMNRDGSDARPVTSEKRVVNQAAWSPDGEWVACKKRITDYSSLGTAELWLVNLRGGSGVQLTAKGDLPEAGEPVFSPDGRYLYYSARPSRYAYDRNVYAGIYQIRRFDRVTGDATVITDGFGGSCRPVLSPDGKTMAFVRRERLKTVLGLFDLERGTERILWDGLDDDLMESFAFNGVYPNFAFTPDGRSIVVSGGGQFNRVELSTGKATRIPFTAQVEQVISHALRFPQNIASDQFRVRMISWPTPSPDGRTLVFAAIGSLWSQALPNGTPKKLVTQGGLAYAPTFSRDGRTLAYVSWNDREGGHVWTMPAGGGGSKRLTSIPAQYANPSFSPDGSRLVLIRGDNAPLRGHDLGDEGRAEVVWVPARGGVVSRVTDLASRGSTRRMPRVSWDAKGERIHYVSTEQTGPGEEKTSLWSIRPDGTDKAELLRFKFAEEVIPSPDGKWAAYVEQFNAYLTALPEVGRKVVEIAGEDGPVPVKKFTNDEGADWINWTEGGRRLTWSFGPRLYRTRLDSVLAYWDTRAIEAGRKVIPPAPGAKKAEAKDESGGRVPTDTLEISLWLPRAKPAGTIALTNGRLITMRGDEVVENGTIVIRDNRITAIGPAAQVAVPAGARVFDCKGKTLMPGMIDTHAHLHFNTLDIIPEQQWPYWCNLAYGVTTTHDPSASTYSVFTESEMVEAGVMKGPRTWSTGYILYGADGAGKAVVNSLDDAKHHLKRLKSLGAFSVKSYMQPRREQRQWIIAAARAESMMVMPEGGGNLEMDLSMVVDGHTSNEHALPVTPLRDDVAQLFGHSQTVETPTLLVAYGGLSGEHWFYQHYEAWNNPKLLRFYPRGALDARAIRRPVMTIDGDWHHIKVAQGAKRILDRGGKVSLGAHGQLQGLGPHWELWGLTQGGIGNHDALRCATLTGAWELGMDRDLGSLETGKLADIVVMDRNPLDKIENSDSIRYVLKNGEVFDGETMRQLWPVEKDRPRFLFESENTRMPGTEAPRR
ncbi:MAG: amidohydrolase family protein [Candidatus Eisenbacteria bacterium]|uniref:Amidohydrolase family protein n=1 Tax=Eiseniibacteriota bacterium TaxID=2212470 RepID=A0A849SP78_UNCEI|nr:amidohydrolase family protein [Candidatus Eisenbacteria bacterium]